MVESRLHHMIVQRKLIPHLPQLIPRLEESINAGLTKELPHGLSKNWTEIQPYHLLKRVSARLAANMIVGPGLCDDPTWLNISFEFTENGKHDLFIYIWRIVADDVCSVYDDCCSASFPVLDALPYISTSPVILEG